MSILTRGKLFPKKSETSIIQSLKHLKMLKLTKQEQEATQSTQTFAVESQNKVTSSKGNGNKPPDIPNVETDQEDNEKPSQLIEREKIDGTPFYCVGNLETGYFIALGRYKLTEPKESVYKCMEQLENDKWNIVMKLVITLMQTMEDEKLSNSTNGNTIG